MCFWRTCRAAGILTLICFLGCRWRGSGPEHAGNFPCRRWFRLTFGSRFNTTSPAGELRGCEHVTGLRVRAESAPVWIPHPFPLQVFVLDLFVALRGTRLSVATLRTYVAGLQHFSFRFGFPTKVAGMHSLGLCCAASNAPRPTAARGRLGDLSVTTLILPRAYIRRHFPARDAIMLLAAVFSAFFGLLRSAGYCSPSLRRFDPGVHLQYSDLALDPERGVGSFRITASKTDPFRGGGGGASVRLCRTGSVLSLHRVTPVAWHTPTFAGPCSHSGTGHT